MLSKDKRLNLKTSFKFVAGGKRVENRYFTIFFRADSNERCLVGVAVSGKQFKEAHDKNRAKRLVFTAVQNIYPQLLNNLNLVIMPKAGVLNLSVEDIIKELEGVKAIYSTH